MTPHATPMSLPAAVEASAQRLHASGRRPRVAVVLGSGWDGVADAVDEPLDIAYTELPAFPVPGVAGHAGTLRLGTFGGTEVALLRGRAHAYETGDAAAMKGAIRTLAAIGCATVVLTNAAGSLEPAMRPGALMLITDHLNLAQRTPLHGEHGNDRFVDLQHAYDPDWCQHTKDAAASLGLTLHEGTYAWMLGPQFETPAEIRMLRLLGAQAVGMSTVPETILARHAGLKVLGLSMITNMGCGMEAESLSHAQTLQVAQGARDSALRLLRAVLAGAST